MDFSNSQVVIDALPNYRRVDFIPLPPRFLRLRLGVLFSVYAVLALAIGGAFTIALNFDGSPFQALLLRPQSVLFLLLAVVLMLLLALFVYAATKAIHFAVRDHDIIVKSGVFWKQEVVQPLKRVQHVEVTRGPLDKRFRLANVVLFSAGTNLSTFRIPGLDQDNAEGIRQFVLDYQMGSQDQAIQRDSNTEVSSGTREAASPDSRGGKESPADRGDSMAIGGGQSAATAPSDAATIEPPSE